MKKLVSSFICLVKTKKGNNILQIEKQMELSLFPITLLTGSDSLPSPVLIENQHLHHNRDISNVSAQKAATSETSVFTF